MKLYTPSGIRELKEKYGFRFSRSLGQNFLVDKNIRDKIVAGSCISPEDLVIEIGPGAGVLTQALAERACRVVAVEIDRNLIPILEETLRDTPNVEILQGDILKCDLAGIIRGNRCPGAVRIVGNLPYYITTPIIMRILEEKIPADSITVMVQKEVADRLAAKPGGKDYGALTVAVRYYCEITRIASAPRDVFFPVPQVDSAVLRLDLRKAPPVELRDESVFFGVIKAGFAMRRKTLHNALSGFSGMDKAKAGEAIRAAGIDPGRRAETLDLIEFARLSDIIYEETNP